MNNAIRAVVATAATTLALTLAPAAASADPAPTTKAACWVDGTTSGRQWVRTFDKAPAYPNYLACGSKVGDLYQGENYVYCKMWGRKKGSSTQYNHWWLWTDLDQGAKRGWVSAYYLTGPGNTNDRAVDVNGRTIRTC